MEAPGGDVLQDTAGSPRTFDAFRTRDPASDPMTEEDGDNCRICRGERTDTQPLFYPCKCSGSIKFVHQDCLMEWLAHSQKKYCELCKTPFRFTKLYDQSMPSTLPLPLFLQQMTIYALRAISRWARFILVGFVWLCWLPWSIRQVWRGLFWLADGSWISEEDIREAAMARMAEVALRNGDGLLGVANVASASVNATLPDSVVKSLPPAIAPMSGFLGISSGEFLVVKIARLMWPNLFLWLQNPASSNKTEEHLIVVSSERQPSLLSGVNFLKSLTGYSILDNAVVDIFEGQLVCLVIITAFILVFLIREWVINQQPILNMPDPDRVDDAAAPAALNGELAPPPRRRRRNLRRHVGEPVQAPNPAGQNVRGLTPPPMPRRAATEDNLTRPTQTSLDDPEPPLLGRSASFATATDFPTGEDSYYIQDEDATVPETEPAAEVRPSLLPRGAFDDAANIRRLIEEATEIYDNDSSGPQPLPTHSVQLSPVPSSTSLVPLQAAGDDVSGSFSHSPQALVTESVVPSAGGALEGENMDELEALSTPMVPSMDYGIDAPSPPLSHESVDRAVSTPISRGPEELEDDSNGHAGSPGTESSGEVKTEEDNPQPARTSLVELLAAWLWQTEDYVANVHDPPPADDERIVEDLDEEEPFVPVDNADRNAPNDHNHEPVHVADPPQPNVQFGIDLNNPDAIEDAEDLDGILELIGVHGPIAAMIQNVIFSEFLITLTIAASVWLPYIWGKITLLVLANPVGVFVKAPLYVASRSADVAVDILILISSLLGYVFSSFAYAINLLLKPIFPGLSSLLQTPYLQSTSWEFAKSSGGRLEKALSVTAYGLKPDLPSFSMQSHHALVVYRQWTSSIILYLGTFNAPDLGPTMRQSLLSFLPSSPGLSELYRLVVTLPRTVVSVLAVLQATMKDLTSELRPLSFTDLEDIDLALMKWSTQDKAIAIVLGYLFFAFVGWMYLKLARFVLGLKPDEKVEGIVADSLRQAGGVMKVVIIIGIEMIIFPLYCGLLLDVALMPLFQGATLRSRIAFMLRAPITALFVHWFIGTCYMFHFALFVSMCRKIMRKGVLYFIRDPDDPTFHPVRDVLERPVATQLGKIAFSALIYGGLVILCLGGVVWTVRDISGILPVRWTISEPRLAFPLDVIFYNFMLPFIIRKANPSEKISDMYEWWLRGCASGLRLTHFLFGEEREEEKGTHIRRTWAAFFRQTHGDVKKPIIGEDRKILAEDREVDAFFYRDGTYVRTPANDSVRIPKGGKVFIEVDENNERVDGKPDHEKGMHGKNDDRFTKVYVPPSFRARIATFIVLLWVFAASTGVAFTVGPLLVGRKTIRLLAHTDQPPNDLYALTIGLHICGALAYAFGHRRAVRDWLKTNTGGYLKHMREALPQLFSTAKYAMGLIYLGITFGIMLPFAFALLIEVYLHVPLYSYLSLASRSPSTNISSQDMTGARLLPATVYVLQTWTLGLLYFRLALRIAMNYPCQHTRIATAIRAIVRHGWTRPDVKLASRAVIIPASLLCVALLLGPLSIARTIVWLFQITDAASRAGVYRYAYPGLLGAGLAVHCSMVLKRQVAVWRVKIRDEVYLIGERLHNFNEVKKSQPGLKLRGEKRSVGERVDIG